MGMEATFEKTSFPPNGVVAVVAAKSGVSSIDESRAGPGAAGGL
jgi:hypothetical protein